MSDTVAERINLVRSHVRKLPLQPSRYTRTVVITLDNGKRFVKLEARSPGRSSPLEKFRLANGRTVKSWMRGNPSFRILSYRAVTERKK